MPKSKRSKVVHMSKVDKKGKEHSQKLFANVQDAANTYPYIFVFAVENMRNNYLKEVRTEFSDGKICFGKTTIMAKALGTTVEEEHLPNLHSLSKHLKGDVGLLFTSRDPAAVIDFFSSFSKTDYARAGTAATSTFTVPAGPVYSRGGELPAEEDVLLPHSVEVQMRKWGMPTRLDKGKIMLDDEYILCKEGQTLNSHQTALLKQFGVAMAEFRIALRALWRASDGEVTVIQSGE